jgi:hypothetical protein
VKTDIVESWFPSRSSLPRSYLNVLAPQLKSRSCSILDYAMRSQRDRIGRGNNGNVDVLSE